jgi:hypothetical protein
VKRCITVLPQVEVKGSIEETRQRVKSLLNSSGLQVFDDSGDSLKFRKVRLEPSGRIPLSIYGSGIVKLEPLEEGLTRVVYRLYISPVTVFSFVITGFSIVVFAVFVDYFLITSGNGLVMDVLVPVMVVSLVSFSMMPILILSFLKTKRRAENFLRAFLVGLP